MSAGADDDAALIAWQGFAPALPVAKADHFVTGLSLARPEPVTATSPHLGPCAACRYWLAPTDDALSHPWGECRASHPAEWRMTRPVDGCGVFDRVTTTERAP